MFWKGSVLSARLEREGRKASSHPWNKRKCALWGHLLNLLKKTKTSRDADYFKARSVPFIFLSLHFHPRLSFPPLLLPHGLFCWNAGHTHIPSVLSIRMIKNHTTSMLVKSLAQKIMSSSQENLIPCSDFSTSTLQLTSLPFMNLIETPRFKEVQTDGRSSFPPPPLFHFVSTVF